MPYLIETREDWFRSQQRDWCEDGFLSLEDAWWRLQQLYPNLAQYHSRTFPSGKFWPFNMDKTQAEILVEFDWEFWDSNVYVKDPQNLSRIASVIGIPEGIAVSMKIEEF